MVTNKCSQIVQGELQRTNCAGKSIIKADVSSEQINSIQELDLSVDDMKNNCCFFESIVALHFLCWNIFLRFGYINVFVLCILAI